MERILCFEEFVMFELVRLGLWARVVMWEPTVVQVHSVQPALLGAVDTVPPLLLRWGVSVCLPMLTRRSRSA